MRRIKHELSEVSSATCVIVRDADTGEYLGTIYLTRLRNDEKCVTHGKDWELIETTPFTKPENPNQNVWTFSYDLAHDFPIDEVQGILKFLLWEDAWEWLKRHSEDNSVNGKRRKAARMARSIANQIAELQTFIEKHEESCFYVGGRRGMSYYEMEYCEEKYHKFVDSLSRTLGEALAENKGSVA